MEFKITPESVLFNSTTDKVRFYNYLLLLVELHNTVSLLEIRKAEYLADKAEDHKYWYNETAKGLQLLNNMLKSEVYNFTFSALCVMLENSRFQPQSLPLELCLIADADFELWKILPIKLEALKFQKKALNELSNKMLGIQHTTWHQPESPVITVSIKELLNDYKEAV